MTDNNYTGNSIEILEGLEPVRLRPGMYIGSVSSKGLTHLIYEIVDNAVDEHLAGYCSEISVTLEADGSCTVKDNGRGIPVGINEKSGRPAVEVVFTMLHAGGKFSDGNYKISGGLHGVGAAVVNALSEWLEVDVYADGKIYNQRYERGKVMYDLRETGTCRKSQTGTLVRFLPDKEIFEKTYFKADAIKSRLHETAYLNPNLTIIFENKRFNEQEREEYHEPEGLSAYIKDMNEGKSAVTPIVSFKGKEEGIEVEVAFQFVDEFQE
ncbi:MAG: DNA topoisomerase IV subunit B, partial [Parasporobacterium sp.]|nr:DNA topoisomerase IV subunit B [Parasporobacterium sp.]